jgi:DMSO/TMAO reductase YedYZ molybdopterin-dependent catalytic subunit
MVGRVLCIACFLITTCAASAEFSTSPAASAQSTSEVGQLKIGGAAATPLMLTIADLKKMPRTTLHVENPHEKKSEVYEGVLLEELLQRAGVPHGEKLRGPLMATYVVAEASDGYRVVFALAELDSDFMSSEILVADTVDGGPIDEKRGPLRLVVPHDKRPARWVRMLKSITVASAKDMN